MPFSPSTIYLGTYFIELVSHLRICTMYSKDFFFICHWRKKSRPPLQKAKRMKVCKLRISSILYLTHIFLFSFWKCEQHTFWSIKSKPLVIPLFSKSDLNRKFHFVVINVIDWSNECIYVNNCVPFVWKRNLYGR